MSRGVLACWAVVRLTIVALLTLAVLACTAHMAARDWNSGLSSPEECVELRAVDEAVRHLGLDGLPEYWQSCFTLQHRLWTAARPFSEPAAELMQGVAGHLHRVALLVYHTATAPPVWLLDQLTALLEWHTDTLMIALLQHSRMQG